MLITMITMQRMIFRMMTELTTTPLAPDIVATAQPCSTWNPPHDVFLSIDELSIIITLALDRDGILLQEVPSQASAVRVPISASQTGFT